MKTMLIVGISAVLVLGAIVTIYTEDVLGSLIVFFSSLLLRKSVRREEVKRVEEAKVEEARTTRVAEEQRIDAAMAKATATDEALDADIARRLAPFKERP